MMRRYVLILSAIASLLLGLTACKPTAQLKVAQPDFAKPQSETSSVRSLSPAQQWAADEIFLDAMTAYVLEDWRKAETLLVQLTGIDPTNATAFFKLSEVYAQLRRFSTAAIYAERACQLEPDNVTYIEHLAHLFRNLNRHQAAIGTWAYLLKMHPTNKNYVVSLAQDYYIDKDWISAVKALDYFLQRNGNDIDILEMKAQLLVEFVHYKDAEPVYLTLLEMNPNESRYHVGLCTILQILGKYSQLSHAITYWSSVLPDDPARRVLQLGYYDSRGDTSKIMGLLKQLVALPNTNPEPLGKLLNRYVTKYPCDTELRDLIRQRALQDLQEPELLSALNIANIELLDTMAMIKDGHLFMDHFPMAFLGAYAAYLGYAMMENDSMQFALFDSIAWYYRDNLMHLEMFCAVHVGLLEKRNDETLVPFYEQCVSLFPNNPHFLNNYAYYLAKEGVQLDRAVKMAGKALSLSQEPHVIDTYAWTLFKAKRYAEALEIIEMIPFREMIDALYFEHYGDILYQNQQLDKAVQMWENAYRIDPSQCSPQLPDKILKKSIQP